MELKKNDVININHDLSQIKNMVTRYDGEFLPLFSPHDVSRDKFIQLRKELIALGCRQDEVIPIAKQLSMEVLKIKSEVEYHNYIINQTYQRCREIILNGYEEYPVQDLNYFDYSHTELFSSIYGFEIDYLRARGITQGIADFGCGDGLFLQLLNDFGMKAEGFEIDLKGVRHDVAINVIKNISDVNKSFEVVFLNHVLEHITDHPNIFLDRLISHFNSIGKVKAFIISLPIHLSVHAHLASDHQWVCYNEQIPSRIYNMLVSHNLKFFRPDLELNEVAEKYGYSLKVYKNIGTYVIE
jgi:hypothetical protein